VTRSGPSEFEFTEPDDPRLLAAAEETAARGSGWINLEPVVDEEYQPARQGSFPLLSGPSHEVPTATWLPGRHLPSGETKPTTIGLQHAARARVVWQLRDLGLPLPDGWRVTQDHPRRGLVVSIPAGADAREAIAWLVRATDLVCAVPSTGRWRASVYSGAPG
jgi:hypothetical protein